MAPGEAVVWVGRPRPGVSFHGGMVAANLLGLGLLVLGLVWNPVVLSALGVGEGAEQSAYFRALMGVCRVGAGVAGLMLTIGVHVAFLRRMRKTAYAITDRAAYVWTDEAGVARHLITSVATFSRGGWGDRRAVHFGYQSGDDIATGEVRHGEVRYGEVRYGEVRFQNLPDPDAVLAVLRQVKEART